MTERLAKYACDTCRSRKIACSRETDGCRRCHTEGLTCKYSRTGVIRRSRKRKASASPGSPPLRNHHGSPPTTSMDRPRSQWDAEIVTLRERLPPVAPHGRGPFKVLSTIADENEAFWQDRSDLLDGTVDPLRSEKGYFLFEEHVGSWADLFVSALHIHRPLLTAAPAEVLEHLASSRPDQVNERAWLVIYYGIILSTLSSTTSKDENMTARLRANLWLAFNDTRLLMEPSDLNIQALTLLACHVEPFTTPSLCWMLLSNACRMLHALGVNHRVLDPDTRERRLMLFWHLNMLEKSMALIFPWPPTFHQAMANELPLPTLEQLLPLQHPVGSDKRPSLFGAHLMQQVLRVSRVAADIWCALNEHETGTRTDQAAKRALDDWYREAREILEAAALAEKPLLDPAGAASVQLGLDCVKLQYYGCTILLTRGRSEWESQCHDVSLKMLHLLSGLRPDPEQPHIGVVWQSLYYPWAPFLVLFGKVLREGEGQFEEKKQALEAMEHLPAHLENLRSRYRDAAKLELMATATVQHARSILFPEDVPAAIQRNGSVPAQDPAQPQQSLPTSDQSHGADSGPPTDATTSAEARTQNGSAEPQDLGHALPTNYRRNVGLPGAGPWLWADMEMPQAWPTELQNPFADTMFGCFAWDGQL